MSSDVEAMTLEILRLCERLEKLKVDRDIGLRWMRAFLTVAQTCGIHEIDVDANPEYAAQQLIKHIKNV